MGTDVGEEVRQYWDRDAATYDRSPSHRAATELQQAAWTSALVRHLPQPAARVLDVGAGTGFLSLAAARLGHRVTALDVSAQMLERLRDKAAAEQLDVEIVESPAERIPGDFDAIVERHVVWTLADPQATMRAWREAAPSARLVLFESAWGCAAGPYDALCARANHVLRSLRGSPPHHHAPYSPGMRGALPLGSGVSAQTLAALVAASGWSPVRVERLRDVEWAIRQAGPAIDRLAGLTPRFAIAAG